ncbi:Dentin sialophosphoprotein-like protein [Hirschfeldia incana]|nr:Dentin sialophosphoprotein-like protein [Hirschfeldia incana]
MPGNEYGERIHNFFGQEGLSQDQHQSQVVDGTWSGFTNGLGGNQRQQIDPSLVPNLKSYTTQQQSDDHERGQSSNSQHGFTQQQQQPMRSEYSRGLLQDNQQLTNGYVHGQAMPNGSSFLGMDVTSSRDNLSAKGFSPNLHKGSMRFEMGESPVNYDFFGGQQQQLNSQLPGMLQPFPRQQQMTFNDMQLLKEQAMVKQMHEYQMQQQLHKQQLEARQLNSLNLNGVSGNRSSNYQSHPLINGVPLQDASGNNWQPDLMAGNTNWMHRGISPAAHGLSSGLMITPEQGQANLMAQQFEPSLYGMPLGGVSASQNSLSSVQMNRLPAQHGSSLINQPTSFGNQGVVQDGHMLPRSPYQEKVLFSQTSVPDSNNRPSSESFQLDDSRERNCSVQERFGQMESSGPLEKSYMKEPENVTALQKSTTLDPTEEKILFGSDDNLWSAFGSNTDMSLTGNLVSSSSDLLDGCPSMKLGSWSALMQSAVEETSSNDAAFGSMAQNLSVKASNVPSDRLHSDSTRTSAQHVHENGVLEKPMAQRSQLAGNFFNASDSGIDRQSNSGLVQKNEGIGDRFGIWKAASNPSLAAAVEQKNHFTQNLQMQRASYGFDIANAGNNSSASRDVQGNIQQHFNNNSMEKAIPQVNSRAGGSHIFESYANVSNNACEGMAETNEMRNTGKDNSNDSSGLKFSQQSLSHGFKKDTQGNAFDSSMFPGGKDTEAGRVGSRPSISRTFQYHPMGNIGVTDEPNRENVSHLPPTVEQVSVGNQVYFGQSKSLGQSPMNMQTEKGHVSQNDVNCRNEAFRGPRSGNSTNASASADRSVDLRNQMKSSSRQPMLELLDKVDQSQEHSLETDVSRISEATPSAENGGQFRHSQSSASQGFNLQLAPPSQSAPSPGDVQPNNSLHTAREKGTGQSRFAPWASNQSSPQQSTYQGPISGIPVERNITSGFPYPRGYHQNQLLPAAIRQSVSNHLVGSSSELSTPQVKEREECSDFEQRGHSAQTSSSLNPTTHSTKENSAEGFTMLSAPHPPVASSSPTQSSSSGMMSDSRACISAPQHRFWNQPSKPQPDVLRSHSFSNSHVEGSFSSQEKKNRLSSQNRGDISLSGRDTVNILGLPSKDMGSKQTSDAASMFSKMIQSNHQTFDSSLSSNNLPKDNLGQDEHMAGSGEGDAPKIPVKRVDNSSVHLQTVASKGEQQSPSRSDGLVRDGLNQKDTANQMLHFGKRVSESFSIKNQSASGRADHQQISPQMAPSWYSQYGTFKNGVVQPVNDTGRVTPLKIGEQSSDVGSSAGGLLSVPSSKQFNVQHMPGSTPGAETPSSESLAHGDTDKLLNVVVKPKKRKTATSELQSWNKEVMQGSLRLKTLSDVEVEWVRATNRFAEKMEFETLIEDSPPIRSKRRLIYTRQLMQQLFRHPPARVISFLASSNYEFVAYTAARAALGDACSSTFELFSPLNKSNPLSEGRKAETVSDQYFLNAAEDFLSRSRKLETDFAGLQKGTTIADLCVEVQDLEKFAVINRFAKFHPTSSSVDRTVSSVKLNPQRYVTIAPMPQNIPDRVQCLSL